VVQLLPEEVFKTVILASIGAVASFAVSMALKWVWAVFRKVKGEK
jgi:hypothetical protein